MAPACALTVALGVAVSSGPAGASVATPPAPHGPGATSSGGEGPTARPRARLTAASSGFAGNGVPGFGDATDYGGIAGLHLDAPATALAATPDGKGYWVGAADGGVFAFGDAPYEGSMGGRPLEAPIVGMAATADGRGYWLVAADGGIFAFGDAPFYGSMGGTPLNQPIVGMAATADGRGYWLVAADGGIFAFGDAPFYGSAANQKIGTWVTGMARTADGQGYWLVAATGGVLTFGDATFYGPTPNLPPFAPTTAIAATPDGKGYWLLQPNDGALNLDPVSPTGDWPSGGQAVRIAEAQVGPDPDASQGPYCNPYGPCEEWCSLFATWVWQQVGIGVPSYPFTGNVYKWGQATGIALPGTAVPQPGDFVMYGTGPQNSTSSLHMGIVAQVWPDGAITTVEGDAGPEPTGQNAVVVNGPFLPADAANAPAIGMPVYGYLQP